MISTDLFGIEFPIPIYSFGALVAIAILVDDWPKGKEVDRKYENGQVYGVEVDHIDGSSTRTVNPSVLVGTLAVIAAVMGIVGAKLFTLLGNPGRFLFHPADVLFSTRELTFYGGLILVAGAIVSYVGSQGLSVRDGRWRMQQPPVE